MRTPLEVRRDDTPIGIAIFPDKTRLFRITARDVHDDRRSGEEATFLVDAEHFMLAQALAARHARQVGEDHVDRVDIGIGGKERLCFVQSGDVA